MRVSYLRWLSTHPLGEKRSLCRPPLGLPGLWQRLPHRKPRGL